MGHQMQEWDHIGDAIGFDTFSFVSWFSNAVDLGMVVVLGGFERINDWVHLSEVLLCHIGNLSFKGVVETKIVCTRRERGKGRTSSFPTALNVEIGWSWTRQICEKGPPWELLWLGYSIIIAIITMENLPGLNKTRLALPNVVKSSCTERFHWRPVKVLWRRWRLVVCGRVKGCIDRL